MNNKVYYYRFVHFKILNRRKWTLFFRHSLIEFDGLEREETDNENQLFLQELQG